MTLVWLISLQGPPRPNWLLESAIRILSSQIKALVQYVSHSFYWGIIFWKLGSLKMIKEVTQTHLGSKEGKKAWSSIAKNSAIYVKPRKKCSQSGQILYPVEVGPKRPSISKLLFCILCHNFWTNWGSDMFSTSKWQSEPQFVEGGKLARNGQKTTMYISLVSQVRKNIFAFCVITSEPIEV